MEKTKAIVASLAELNTPDAIAKLNKYAGDIRKKIIQENNDERIKSLELLESFAFRVPEQALSIIEMFTRESSIKEPTEYKQPYKIKGQAYSAVLDKSVEIIRQYNLRYGSFQRSFQILLKYYSFRVKDKAYEAIRKKAQDIIAETADYNMKIIYPDGFPFQGYRFQSLYVEKITDMLTGKERIFDLAVAIAERIFKTEVEGTYWDYKTVSIRFGPLAYTKSLERLRNKLLKLLFERIKDSKDINRLIKMINCLSNATSFPTRGKYSDSLELMIMKNISKIIDFYSKFPISRTSPVIIQEIEQQMSFHKRRFSGYKNNNKKMAKSVLRKSVILLDKIRNEKFYKLYRTFVGDITDFWDESDNYEKIQTDRKQQVKELIASITASNLRGWSQTIRKITTTYALKQHHEFENLFMFAREFGKAKPELAGKLITLLEKQISTKNFLTEVVIGMRQSGRGDMVYSHIKRWLKSKNIELILEVPFTYWVIDKAFVGPEDFMVFDRLNSLSLPRDKREELDCRIVQALPWIYESDSKKSDKILFKVLKRMSPKNISFFTRTLTIAQHRKQIDLKKWPIASIKRLVDAFLKVERLDFHEKEILAIYATKKPLGIVDFFEARINISKRSKKEGSIQRYDAIPFHLDDLAKTIIHLPEYRKIIRKVLNNWMLKKDWLFQWEAKHFLQRLSPGLDKTLSSELDESIQSGNKTKIIAALEVLDAYQGAPLIDELCKKAIKVSKGDKDIKKVVGRALYQTGVVTGEFGMRDAYNDRLTRVKKWTKDKNKYVRLFSNEYSKSLEKSIQAEQTRTEEEIMRMKKGVYR